VKNLLAAIGSAFAYFSILPSDSRFKHEPPAPAAIDVLPLVGIVIGAIAGGVGYGISLFTTPLLGYAAAFIAIIVLSGALHLDGFLDSCDALFASVEPQRRLEILKDPRHGTFAVAGMSILTVAWIAALSGCAPQKLPLVLAYACLLARISAVFPMQTSSKFANFIWLALACIGSFFMGPWAWAGIPTVIGLNYLAARWTAKRLGGSLTGDSYGFLIAIAEPLVLLLLDIKV
jgi:adenosylcobinamide-GDP ribazoletransferase